jgi:hypothetical protein
VNESCQTSTICRAIHFTKGFEVEMAPNELETQILSETTPVSGPELRIGFTWLFDVLVGMNPICNANRWLL